MTIGINKIGYIGCSNTRDSVRGYNSLPTTKKRFWLEYDTGGGSIDKWAIANSNYWTLFDAQVALYGQPTAVWVQLCENTSNPVTYDDVTSMLTNLNAHSPDATVYISAINSYEPIDLCALMGADGHGVSDTVVWRDQAVSDSLAKLGPALGPLTVDNTVADGCHCNAVGGRMLGQQLKAFFDVL